MGNWKRLVAICWKLPRNSKRAARKLLKRWSRGRELNSRPADYESAALPLSYLGLLLTIAFAENGCQLSERIAAMAALFAALAGEGVHGPADADADEEE